MPINQLDQKRKDWNKPYNKIRHKLNKIVEERAGEGSLPKDD